MTHLIPEKLVGKNKRIYIRPLRASDFGSWKGSQAAMAAPRSEFDVPLWGRGYELGLNRIEAYIEPVDLASVRTAEAGGFKKEGLARKKLFTRKAWRNVLVYAAVCSDHGFKLNPPEL